MNLGQLRSNFRLRVHDLRGRLLWNDDEANLYANEAVKEAAERAKLIFDDKTSTVCSIAGKADTAVYKLHPSIFEVESCTWDGRFLGQKSRSTLDEEPIYTGYRRYGWDTFGTPMDWRNLKGNPDFFIFEQNAQTVTLARCPTRAAPIKLTVYRYPLDPMVADEDEPELPERYHYDLIDWMAHLAYLKQDTETFDPQAAKRAESDFVKNFGVKLDANVRRQQREGRTHQVRFNPDW